MQMILSETGLLAAQIFVEKHAPSHSKYHAMVEVARDGRGALQSMGFATRTEALAWLLDKLTFERPAFERIEG